MNKKVCLLVMAGLLWSKGLLAEETTKSYTGSELVVTSSRVEEEKKSVTSSITVIGKEEIEESPAKDLGELLAEKSIGHIQKYPGTMTSVGIRGFRTETHGNDLMGKVLVLLNGRRAGTGNLAKLSTGNIDRIEIIRGPAAVQYGSAAIGGIVNVITARGEGMPSLFFEQELGSNQYTQSSVGASGKSGKVDFSGSVSLSEMDSYKTGKGTEYANTAYSDRAVGNVQAGFEFLPNHRIGVIYNYFNVGKAGSPSYLSQVDSDAYTSQKAYSTDVVYEGSTADRRFSWMARYFTGRDKYLYADPSSEYTSKNKVEHKGAQAQATYSGEALRLTAGMDWIRYDLESTLAPLSSGYENPACFVLGKYGFLSDRLVLTAGLRYDSYDVTIGKGQGSSQSADNLSRQAGLAWNPSDALKLRASYAEGFRMPSARELVADFYSWRTHYVGNPDLKPEKSRSFEAGAEVNYRDIRTSLTWFTTDFRDKIQSTSTDGNMTWTNIGGATVSGIEAELSWVLHPFGPEWKVEPYVNGTWLTEYRDDETGEKLTYTPELSVTSGLRVADRRGFSCVFNLAYTGETQVVNWEDWSGDVVAKGGYTVANLSVSKKFLIDEAHKQGRGLTLRCTVENLFDREYQYVKGYTMPGRTFVVGIRADI